MSTSFAFAHQVVFAASRTEGADAADAPDPERARAALRAVPELPGIFALFGHSASDQPYVTRGANLRRRLARLLDPPETAAGADGALRPVSRRLNLRNRVARIAWTATGSEFESLLLLYRATSTIFGTEQARHRLKLRAPYVVRFTREGAHPRLYVTNRISRRSFAEMYGPFPSRMAAERYCDAVLDLFRLRRCHELLVVSPEHPGCIYGEMKRCMAPCNMTCTAEKYSAEAEAVQLFLQSRGESLLGAVAAERESASEAMDFERAAALHAQWEKVRAAANEASELVTSLDRLRAVIVQRTAAQEVDGQASAMAETERVASPSATDVEPEQAAIFLFERGRLAGPERLSTRGVRAVREQTAVGSSLFAQPLMLQAVPLPPEDVAVQQVDGEATMAADHVGAIAEERTTRDSPRSPEVTSADRGGLAVSLSPEDRLISVLEDLAAGDAQASAADVAEVSDYLALLRRWYYRPEKHRAGELFLPNADGSWPRRRILNAAARAALGDPKSMQETNREGAKAAKTRLLHAGREGVERAVPVLNGVVSGGGESQPFRSRRRRGQTT